MSSLLINQIVTPVKQNPTLGVTVGTGILCFVTYWWYNASTCTTLRNTQMNCHRISEKALQECREMLKNGENTWGADIRARDGQVRRLELQNVEQTRSIARLESAMKMCLMQNS